MPTVIEQQNICAVRIFERDWLINLILFGNYHRLGNSVLAELGAPLRHRTLQIACVYGDLTLRLRAALAPDARLEVVDILPIQLQNLRSKLPADERVTLVRDDAASLAATTDFLSLDLITGKGEITQLTA